MNTAQIQIYGPSFSTFVRSVMLLCEELNISYVNGFEINGKTVDFKSEQYATYHPFNKLPLLVDGDVVLTETLAICHYLINQYGVEEKAKYSTAQLAKIDAYERMLALYVDKAIVRDYLLEFAFPKGDDQTIRFDVVKAAQADVRNALAFIEHSIEQPWFQKGQMLSIADVIAIPMLAYLIDLPEPFNLVVEFPKIEQYLSEMQMKASVKKILLPMKK